MVATGYSNRPLSISRTLPLIFTARAMTLS